MTNYQESDHLQEVRDNVRKWVEQQPWYKTTVDKEDRSYYSEEGLEHYKLITGEEFLPPEVI